MLVSLILLVLLLLPLLVGLALLLGRRLRHLPDDDPFSPVTRQHFEIFQTGEFDDDAVEAVKRRYRTLFERGEEARVEASLRPGMQYVYQVRALAELGTDAAGQILERQLRRRLTDDRLEQTWYWIDLASSLRVLNRQESLPLLFRVADHATDVPLGHFFAAETVCFFGFSGYVRQPETAAGRAALRILHRAMEGLRVGVQPQLVAEARLGEVIEALWDHRPPGVAPLLVRVFAEALRLARRAPHARAVMAEDPADQEAFDWQLSRLAALEPAFRDYLHEAPDALRAELPHLRGAALADALRALDDLRADVGLDLLPLLDRPRVEHPELAVGLMRWARDRRVGKWLRERAARGLDMERRARTRRQARPPRRPSTPADLAYGSILYSLRGHPSVDTERLLVRASQDWDPTYRAAALSSLGWWEPLVRDEVLRALEAGRRDPSPDVRQAARAALARLGERAALHWFRQALLSDNAQHVFETVHVIAGEGLTLLWPELDRLADTDNPETIHHVREALERLFEEMEQPQAW